MHSGNFPVFQERSKSFQNILDIIRKILETLKSFYVFSESSEHFRNLDIYSRFQDHFKGSQNILTYF